MVDELYFRWNEGIIESVATECAPDEPVFLAIDADRLAEVAARCEICSTDRAKQSFVEGVRSRCIVDGKISVTPLAGFDENGRPCGVAFLALLVLAANERGEAGDDRFYLSLSRLLWPQRSVPASTRQDLRMPPGEQCEEPLWRSWSAWLLQQGFTPTARRGQGPRDKFRMYPISQATLSTVEKRYLAHDVFGPALVARQMLPYLDLSGFDTWLRRRVQSTPPLWKGISDRISGRDRVGGHRFPPAFRDAFLSECYGVYGAVSEDPSDVDQVAGLGHSRSTRPVVTAGLVREACLDGSVEYRLRPSRPRHTRGCDHATVIINEDAHPLVLGDDPNWFEPIGAPLSSLCGARWVIQDMPNVVAIELPQRDFWLLAPDANAPSDQLLVSDRRPDPDERFIVLVDMTGPKQQAVHSTLDRCKDAGLLDWQSTAEVIPGWREYRRCRILISPWRHEPPPGADPDVYFRLTPEASDTIRFEGGLRRPNIRSAFMEGCLPAIAVVTEADPLAIRLAFLDKPDEHLCEVKGRRGKLLSLPSDLAPGNYVVHAFGGDGSDERELSSRRMLVSSWTDMTFESTKAPLLSTLRSRNGTIVLCGPRCEVVAGDAHGGGSA